MKGLQRALTSMFRPTSRPDPQRRQREEAKALAHVCGCEIEKCGGGWNVWPQKGLELDDPFDGYHYAQDWEEALEMVRTYAKLGGYL